MESILDVLPEGAGVVLLDPERVRVIYNGIDVSAWHPVADPELLAGLGIDDPYL